MEVENLYYRACLTINFLSYSFLCGYFENWQYFGSLHLFKIPRLSVLITIRFFSNFDASRRYVYFSFFLKDEQMH